LQHLNKYCNGKDEGNSQAHCHGPARRLPDDPHRAKKKKKNDDEVYVVRELAGFRPFLTSSTHAMTEPLEVGRHKAAFRGTGRPTWPRLVTTQARQAACSVRPFKMTPLIEIFAAASSGTLTVDKTPASLLDSIPIDTCNPFRAAMCACGVIMVPIVLISTQRNTRRNY